MVFGLAMTRFEVEVLYAAHRHELDALAAQWRENKNLPLQQWWPRYEEIWLSLETKLGMSPTKLLDLLNRWFW